MMRWLITGLIVGFGGFIIHARVGSPFQPGADTAYLLGRIVGGALFPVFFGLVVAWIIGRFSTGSPGALHRRTNWVALIALILTTAGQFAQKVQ